MSTLVITIDADTDIVMSGSPTSPTAIGVTAYSEPAILARPTYAPTSPYLHGAVALAWSYDQSLLSFTVAPFGAANEAAADVLIESLRTALSRITYQVTTSVNSAAKVWRCDPGSVVPAGPRSRIDVARPHVTEWNVSIPCHPVRVS